MQLLRSQHEESVKKLRAPPAAAQPQLSEEFEKQRKEESAVALRKQLEAKSAAAQQSATGAKNAELVRSSLRLLA